MADLHSIDAKTLEELIGGIKDLYRGFSLFGTVLNDTEIGKKAAEQAQENMNQWKNNINLETKRIEKETKHLKELWRHKKERKKIEDSLLGLEKQRLQDKINNAKKEAMATNASVKAYEELSKHKKKYREWTNAIHEKELSLLNERVTNAKKERDKLNELDKLYTERVKALSEESDTKRAAQRQENENKFGINNAGKLAQKIANLQEGNKKSYIYENQQKVAAWNKINETAINGMKNIQEVAGGIIDWTLATKKSNLKEAKNQFDAQQKLFKAHMEMSNTVVSNMVTTFNSLATQNAIDASKSIATAAMSEANQIIKMTQSLEMAQRDFDVAEKERILEENKAKQAAAKRTASGAAAISNMLGPYGQLVGTVITGLTDISMTAMQERNKFKEFDIEKTKQENEIYNSLMENITAVAEKAKNLVTGVLQTANAIADKLRANETIYKQTGTVMGFNEDVYSAFLRELQPAVSEIFNITAEQMKSMSDSYASASGRSLIFSADEYNKMTAVSRTFGISQGEYGTMNGEMNIFNTSIEDSYNIMDDMYKLATKLGLSTSKFSKDLTNNLKLAQKYNFKGGVDNMAKLTMWANRVRFDLQNAATFADKMMSNNISDVLETSAKLQVLGGNAAIYSDPMAMMWEAGNDVGALAKRQYAMFGDITGSFNSTTGETTFTNQDLRFIKARADAMGMNYEDVLNQRRQSNKQGVINRALAKYNLSDDILNGIGQRATYDKKSGQFMVDTLDGRMSIDELAGMGSDYISGKLLPENTDEAIMDIAKDTRSLVEKAEAQTSYYQTLMGTKKEGYWENLKTSNKIEMESQASMFKSSEFKEALNTAIVKQAELTKIEQKNTVKQLEDNNSLVNQYFSFAEQNAGKQNAMSAAELIIMSKLAETNGVKDLSTIMEAVTTIYSEAPKNRYSKAKQIFRNDPEKLKLFLSLTQFDNSYPEAGTTNEYKPTNRHEVTTGDAVMPTRGRSIYTNGLVINPSVNDVMTLSKPGGSIDASRGGGGTQRIEFSGNINLTDSYGSMNIVDVLKRDPVTAREFVRVLIKVMDETTNGKTTKNHLI